MSLHMTIDEWKAGIPQRELEKKIREYEENLPEREKMTAQARENNQTRFFLEDRFYELHKKELADMMAEKAAENGLHGFREGNQGVIPIAKSSSEGSNVGFTPLPTSPTLGEGLDSAYSGGGLGGAYSGGGLDSANIGLEASALTPPSYGAAVSNDSQQFAGGYGNGYAADYTQPTVAAKNSQSMLPGGMTPTTAREPNTPWKQVTGALGDMVDEYNLMKKHDYKFLDDYYHCKANYNAASRGKYGDATSQVAGNLKEAVDYFKNRVYRNLSFPEARKDYWHDLGVNQIGRDRAKSGEYASAQDACADFRARNPALPKEYW